MWRLHARWAFASAASIALAVVLTLQIYPGERDPAKIIEASIVELQPGQFRMVNVLLDSPRPMENARITVQWDDNLELQGYEWTHDLQWQATLKGGKNKLSLPVQLMQGQSGMVTVTVTHDGARKRFSVLIKAAPVGSSTERTI